MTSDLDLLRQFAREDSQDAFREIVRRHLDLVYSAALRQVRSPQLAEEITQSVFADLARAAAGLKPDTILTAWLYAVARRTAVDVVRKESRRQLREHIAIEMNTLNATADDWTQIAPFLDDAMATLDETDRAAVLLRYFENKSLREVGDSFGISEDAAQKRVGRAVERLREFLSKRKLSVGAGALAALISANAVQSAPFGLAATVSSSVLAGTLAMTQTMGMTMIHKILITGMAAAAVGVGIFTVHLQKQIDVVRGQQALLLAQLAELRQERDNATNQLAGLLEENARLKSYSGDMELLKLRGEVTLLQNALNAATSNVPAAVASPWSNWNNAQTIGSFYAVAGTATETVGVGIEGRIAIRNNATGVWKVRTFGHPDFRGIVYADNQYVVVREGGSIMTSPDGIEWTKRDSPTTQSLLGIFWDGHQFLAGGDNGTILASSDGIHWVVRNSGEHISFYSFGYSGAQYVAVGNDGIMVSSDSVTWTAPASAPRVPLPPARGPGMNFSHADLVWTKIRRFTPARTGTFGRFAIIPSRRRFGRPSLSVALSMSRATVLSKSPPTVERPGRTHSAILEAASCSWAWPTTGNI
jgi:RNA polymerase sigma factor (sigma-70 family)